MNLDNLKNNVCTLSTRNLDPSLATADIRVAFTSAIRASLMITSEARLDLILPTTTQCHLM